ncbi:hypothetical protein ACUH9Y_07260 [Dermabacteraceae bacterium P13115]
MNTLPVSATFSPELGGRWTSLRGGGREWLWHNEPLREAREAVHPGAAFVDAGGGEECFPCLRSPYDHGDIFNRPWRRVPPRPGCAASGQSVTESVATPQGLILQRSYLREGNDAVLRYQVDAAAPADFSHHAHLLLDLSPSARLIPGPYRRSHFWDGEQEDPTVSEQMMSHLGDGPTSARCFSLFGCSQVRIVDRGLSLVLTLEPLSHGLPTSFVVWRNLNGWPEDSPYRSIGIEPSIGWGVDLPSDFPLAHAAPGNPARWSLRISCEEAPDA